MGVLYRKSCSHCDTRENVTFDGFVGAAINKRELPGQIIAAGHLAYLAPEGNLIVLPHPIEGLALAGAGGKWNSACINGKILSITKLICTDCGTLNSTARVHSGGLGCATGLVAAVLMIAADVWLLQLPLFIEIALVWVALFGPGLIVDSYIRLRYARNAEPFRFRRCENCGGTNAIPLTSNRSQSLPCNQCGQKSVTITFAGKS